MRELKKLSLPELTAKIRHFARQQSDKQHRELVLKAHEYVLELHARQKDRTDGPYSKHALRVAALLIEIEIQDPFVIVAAMLHGSLTHQVDKILENIPLPLRSDNKYEDALAVLERLFGTVVADLVWTVTKPERSVVSDLSEHSMLYVAHIKRAIQKDAERQLSCSVISMTIL